MRSTGNASLTAHVEGRGTTLALCWRVIRRDGVQILGTENDRDIEITAGPRAGIYRARAGITGSSIKSTSDLSVDNLEVEGSLKSEALSLIDLSAADLEAGLFDVAGIQTFRVNSQSPDDGQIILRTGTIGTTTRTAEGKYRAELRGLTQVLTQITTRSYGVSCDAELFDARCGLEAAAFTITGTVTVVTSRRRFDASLALGTGDAAGDYVGGLLTFTSGENQGYAREVKLDAAAGTLGELEFFEVFPLPIAPGDTFNLRTGCDKSHATCRDRYGNLNNFRGHGHFVPGQTEVLKVGGQ